MITKVAFVNLQLNNNLFYFSYGVKECKIKQHEIILSLTYTPRQETLKRKFGNLPLRYVKTHAANDRELLLFEKALQRFQFDLPEDSVYDDEEILPIEPQRCRALESGPSTSRQPSKKIKVIQNEVITPATPVPSPTPTTLQYVDISTDDDCSQRYICKEV